MPLGRIGIATELLQDGRVCVEQVGAVAEGARTVQLRDLQLAEGGVLLVEIEASPGHRNGERHADGYVECCDIDRVAELESTVGALQPTLTVDHQRQLVVSAGDTTVGAKLAQGQSVVAETVGGDRDRLADNGDTTGTTAGSLSVLVRKLRVFLDELSCHDEVPRNEVGVLFAQRLQLRTGHLVELARLDLVRQVRLELARAHRTQTQRIAVLPLTATVPGITASSAAAVRSTRRLATERAISGRAARAAWAATGRGAAPTGSIAVSGTVAAALGAVTTVGPIPPERRTTGTCRAVTTRRTARTRSLGTIRTTTGRPGAPGSVTATSLIPAGPSLALRPAVATRPTTLGTTTGRTTALRATALRTTALWATAVCAARPLACSPGVVASRTLVFFVVAIAHGLLLGVSVCST